MSSLKANYHAIVVEDEKLPREELVNGLNETQDFKVIGSADSVQKAIQILLETTPDVLFLDIKLLDGTAFELLDRLIKAGISVPPTVICSGFREFEFAKRIHNDYRQYIVYIMNKPFWRDWKIHQDNIMDAILLHVHERRKQQTIPLKVIAAKVGREVFLLPHQDVILVKTVDKGSGKSEFVLEDKSYIVNFSLSRLLEKLPSQFLQANRFTIINLEHIQSIEISDWTIYMKNGEAISLGGSFVDYFRDLVDTL